MAQEKIKAKELEQVLETTLSYLTSCSQEEKYSYLREFAQTGLFHDAIGKLVTIDADCVTIETEY